MLPILWSRAKAIFKNETQFCNSKKAVSLRNCSICKHAADPRDVFQIKQDETHSKDHTFTLCKVLTVTIGYHEYGGIIQVHKLYTMQQQCICKSSHNFTKQETSAKRQCLWTVATQQSRSFGSAKCRCKPQFMGTSSCLMFEVYYVQIKGQWRSPETYSLLNRIFARSTSQPAWQ